MERLRPVAPMGIPHGTTEVTDLEGNWTIPKRFKTSNNPKIRFFLELIVKFFFKMFSCMVIPLQWAMNRNKDLWGENAEEFDPSRFVKDGQVVEPEHFLPFQVCTIVRVHCVGGCVILLF